MTTSKAVSHLRHIPIAKALGENFRRRSDHDTAVERASLSASAPVADASVVLVWGPTSPKLRRGHWHRVIGFCCTRMESPTPIIRRARSLELNDYGRFWRLRRMDRHLNWLTGYLRSLNVGHPEAKAKTQMTISPSSVSA